MIDEKILSMKDELIKSIQGCVQIKSVEEESEGDMPFGQGVNEALKYCLELSERLGFKTVNVDNMIGYAEYGSGDEMIAVLGHLDVVPEGDGWTYPPYGAEIHNGKIYGRGTTDDKGPTIGALYALKAIKDLNIPLKRRVRIIFGLNEETGSLCVKHYVEKGEEMPVAGFTPDAEYPIINGEKGIVTGKYLRKLNQKGELILKYIKGGIAPNVVPDYAESEIVLSSDKKGQIKKAAEKTEGIEIEEKENSIIIKSYGVSAHGSTPEKGKNAVTYMMKFLGELDFTGDLKEFIDCFNKYIGTDLNGEKLGIYLEDDISGKLIFNLGTMNGNENEISMEINIRYPVKNSFEDFIDIFRENMKPEQNISITQGNALDLSAFADNAYDITLLLGPMYHLFTDEDKRQAISEALRVTKPGGVLFAAYCISDGSLVWSGFQRKKFDIADYIKRGKIDPMTFDTFSVPEDIFELVRKEDIDRLMSGFPVERLYYVATDLFTNYMRAAVDEMDDETFALYMRYHFAVCERADMVGITHHSLDVFRKRQ